MSPHDDVPVQPRIGIGSLILVGAVGAGIVCNGPFIGVILSAVPALPIAFIAHVLWKRALRAGYLTRAPTRGVVLAGATIVAAGAVYLILRPPTGADLIEKHLGLSHNEISAVQTWTDTWGIDPQYGVKFRADPSALEHAITFARLVPATESTTEPIHILMRSVGSNPPNWWTPERLPNLSCSPVETSNPVLRLCFDPHTGEAYLLVSYF